MEEKTRLRLISREIWVRALYMVLFSVAYSIAEFIIIFLVIFQFAAALFTGRVNAPLLQFGKNLSLYIYEILEFQTFNTELRPFPFSPWPDEEAGGELWRAEQDADDEDTRESDSESGTESNTTEKDGKDSTDTDKQ